MTITAAELRTIGNEKTSRSETQDDIDKIIKDWVHDLALRGVVLEAEEDVTLTDEQANYVESAFTNTFKRINAITIVDDDDKESKPLAEISWQRYKERVAQATSPGKPKEYARFNETIYLWPAPDTDDYPTMKVSGTVYHADSTTISYPNRFRKCGSHYVVFGIYSKYGYAETKGKAYFLLYESEVSKILSDQSTKEVSIQRYSDI